MGVSVYIPTPFRRATTNEARVDIEAGDVQELFDRLEGRFEGPNPDEHIGVHATFKFARRDYGLAWADNAEAKAVGHIVTVEITILAKRVATAPKPTRRTSASPPSSTRGTPGRTSTLRSPATP